MTMSSDSARRVGLVAVGIAVAGCAGDRTAQRGAAAVPTSSTPIRYGHAPVNGISMYYEIHGPAVGTPLVLLHGGGSTIDVTYGRLLPLLARHRTVIALEEQGHGRTSDRDAPVRFDTSADDVAALLATLQVDRADVMGFSNGASVSLRLAIQHPATVRKLIFASSLTKRSGAAPELWGFIANASLENMPPALKDLGAQAEVDEK
jgi:pimeloyl-ACP methyl ester carboxylesterase